MTSEKEIPIDIHTNKLLDWLVSRRHCNRDWQKYILTIRKKINDAIQDMPAIDEIAQLLAGTYINYFHCCDIVNILKKTEASSKNIFGRYSSQRMKDWQEIIKLYEKDNVYMAEAAQMLIRNVNYEIPSLKKRILKCSQMREEYLRKEADYRRSGNDYRDKYYTTCKQIGIEGKNIKKELLSLLEDLPEALSKVTSSVKTLKPSLDYYKAFLQFTLNSQYENCLPLLIYVMKKGNTTVFEWKTGEQPDIVEVTQPLLPIDVDNGSTADEQIDFGDFCVTSESGDDRSSSSPNGDFVHIDKNDCKAEIGDQIDFGENEADINWDIAVETHGITASETQQNNEGGKVARGEDAMSILENPVTRGRFCNELLELHGFLQQRLFEIRSEGDVLSSNLLQSAPPVIQLQSECAVSSMASNVKEIHSELMTTKMKHLYLIKESTKYVDRLADSLKSKMDTSEKMFQLEKDALENCQNVSDEQALLEPKVSLIIRRTKELQSQIEKEVSKRYKDRPVNIMGVMNQ